MQVIACAHAFHAPNTLRHARLSSTRVRSTGKPKPNVSPSPSSRVGGFPELSSARSRVATRTTSVYVPSTGSGPSYTISKEAIDDGRLSFEIKAGDLKQALEKVFRVVGVSGKAGMPSILTHVHLSAGPMHALAALSRDVTADDASSSHAAVNGTGDTRWKEGGVVMAASPTMSAAQPLPISPPRLSIRAGDGQVYIRTSFAVSAVTSAGSAAIPAAPLFSLVRHMPPTAKVQLTCDGRTGTATIVSGGSQFELRGETAGSYPDLPSWAGARKICLPWPELQWALLRTRHAAARERDGRTMFASVCLQPQGGAARFVATDSSRLASATSPVTHDSEPDARGNYVLSMQLVNEAMRALADMQAEESKERGPRERKRGVAGAGAGAAGAAPVVPAGPPAVVTLHLRPERVAMELPNGTLVTSVNLAANNYPDIDALMHRDCDFHMRFNARELEASLKQLLPFVDSGGLAGRIGSSVLFCYKEGVLSLMARSDSIGQGMTSLRVEEITHREPSALSSWKMSFNPHFFLDVLDSRAGASEFMDFGLLQETGPAILHDKGDRQSTFLIMPMGL